MSSPSERLRATSPEFGADAEREAAIRRRHQPPGSAYARHKAEARLREAYNAGADAAWRAYPEPPPEPPRGLPHVERDEWLRGARDNFEWAKVHEEEGWHRVVDGQEVRP